MGSRRSYLQTPLVVALFCHFWTIDGRMPEVRGKVSGVAELTCSVRPSDSADVSSGSLHVVEWGRQGLNIPVLIKFGSYTPRVHPQYEGRVSLVDITTLKLESLQLNDQGPYECRILSLDKPREELRNGTWIMLSVIAAPIFTQTPPPVLEGVVGAHLSLVCAAIGNPLPTITWLKDGSVIQIGNNRDEALSLTALSVQSAGQYTCHASNSEGNATLETKVKIKGPPVIIVSPKSTSLNVSQNALLHCQAVADPSNMTYVWLKGGENVYHVESLKLRVKIMVDGTLLISSLIPEDSGNYTCAPTNGLLTPPTASAILTVMHPAQALQMPRETYLPTGMDGMVNCSSVAQPPLLRVDWTKNGEPLDLSLYPGWTLSPEGNLLMATVNDDVEGEYTCTPFNSYGSMGQSGATKVILQDPPSFSITPEKQYKHKVGRTLVILCQGNDDATVKVSWTKVDLGRRISYSVTPNGSLLLRPLAKDHHGMWECSVSNRVALVKAFTQIFVLGTSPHVATSLSISPGVKQANISWEAGFDGGSAQTFSVWVKKISPHDNEGKQDWFSVPVPSISGTTLLVTGLSPATEYQFSLLSHNKVGTGPFSEITTARTLDPTPSRGQPKPPSLLSANLGSAGVVLQWSLPQAQPLTITGLVLQSRVKQGKWINLDDNISANTTEIIIPGLQKDCVYELRLLTRHGELLSEPSPSLNVSTMGMKMHPSSSRLLESPELLLAGILGGVGFMCLALVLLLGSACLISHRKKLQSQMKQNGPHPASYKCSPSIPALTHRKISGSGSTDGVLKKSLLPASALYPTTSSTISSSSSKTVCSSFNSVNRQHKQQLLFNHKRRLNQFQCLKSYPVSPSVELITRGPDGRFVIPPYDTLNVQSKHSTKYNHPFTVQKSTSLCSDHQDSKHPPFVLSVDLPPCKPCESDTSRQTSDITQHLDQDSFHHKRNYDSFPDFSMCANSLSNISHHNRAISPTFPVLPHIRSGLGQSSTTASTLVLQMEHERERGNLSYCLKLAKEREELAKELQKYRMYRYSKEEIRREKPEPEKRENGGSELIQEYKRHTLPCRQQQRYSLSPSPYLSSSIHWNDFPTMIRDSTCFSPSTPPNSFSINTGNQHPTLSLTGEIPLESEGADHFSNDRLTPPHLYPTMGHERVQETPQGYDDVLQSTFFEKETNVSYSEASRQNNPSFHCQIHGERSSLTLVAEPGCKDVEEEVPKPEKQNVAIEMSVDEPVFEICVTQPAKKPMLHHRIASRVKEGCPRKGRYEEMRRSTSFHYQENASEPELRRAVSQGSKPWDSKQKRQSLEIRQKDKKFLPPHAWVDSLNQKKHSDSFTFHPDSLHADNQSSTTRNSSKYSANVSSASQTTYHLPPGMYPSRSNPLSPVQNSIVIGNQKLRRDTSVFPSAAKWPDEYQDAIKNPIDYLGSTRDSSRILLPDDSNPQIKLDALKLEAEVYKGVPDCGSSYSSFASSGRGSMEPTNVRLSLCHSSMNNNTLSPGTVQEDGQARTVDMYSHQIEKGQRKPSVDENYEWDEADICSQSRDHDGLLPSLNRENTAALCGSPSMKFSTKALTNFSQSSFLQGHQSNCSALPEPDTVLF
ncbi:protein turtle homolog A-like isoform X2 [Phyllopteryx taeniolatus]|uniref:protein turtle homolog A-like isoform X2 n=1 Tax=Phyllopteryx taeniolatus TaxID=161469 RepID=UPI002AD4457A|nr:protein turtle homolog A-like isoform X2 [Phyllopteryx taeniolatus]